jgi:cytochrome P450 family 3 subfamily A
MSDTVVMEAAEATFGWRSLFILPVWVTVPLIFIAIYYIYCTWTYNIFKKMGIPGPKPLPVLGTSLPMMKLGLLQHDLEMRKYGKVVGTFQGRMPLMMIFDADILKQMLVKDFPSFTNRVIPPVTRIPMNRMMHMIKDDDWKRVRGVITPTFSSGKLRKMCAQIRKCSDTLLGNLAEKAKTGEAFDISELCRAFTMDVIASTAFGIEIILTIVQQTLL